MARRNRASGTASRKWRNRDSAILVGRGLIAVAAIVGLFALGHQGAGPAVAPHGPYVNRPATEVEKLTHDLRHEFELDEILGPDRNGWGSD